MPPYEPTGDSQADLVISGDWVICSPEQVLRHGAVAVAGGKITEVGPAAELVRKYPAARRLGGEQRIVLPGLVNTHTHLFQTFLKGLGQDLPLYAWIQRVTTPAAIAMNERDAYLSAAVGLIEAIRSGATSVFEFSYAFPNPVLHRAILQAFLDVGVRGWLGVGLNDTGEDVGIHPALIQPLDRSLAHVEEIGREIEHYGQGWVSLAVTPSSIRGLSQEGLRAVSAYTRSRGAIFSLHVNETSRDNEVCLMRNGKRLIPLLAETGVLGADFVAVHCVRMDEEDVRLLAQGGTPVSHNPVSNHYTGAGIAPVLAMRQAGVILSLGVDGAASNNSQDMLETMKLTALAQRAAHLSPDVLYAADAFAMATVGGARALGCADRLGQLAPGYLADIVVLRSDTAKMIPVHDPLTSVVFSCGEENVESVVVGGRVVMERDCLTTVNEAALLAEAQAAAGALAMRAGIG